MRGRAPKHIKRYVLGALVTKEMKISEVIKNFPETAFTFIKYGLHCVSCPMAVGENVETIEEAVKLHQVDLKKFLKDLNGAIK